jgi:UTP--glucose-1-phosphate uridylyltransferase
MLDFKKLFMQYKTSKGKTIEWSKIQPPQSDMVVPYASLPACPPEKVKELLNKLCIIKLNGGLGTTMGCSGPKSVIEVHSEMSFLDLTVHQLEHLNETYNSNVPLILMNSFNTHEETLKVLSKYSHTKTKIECFNQSRFPRVLKGNFLFVTYK